MENVTRSGTRQSHGKAGAAGFFCTVFILLPYRFQPRPAHDAFDWGTLIERINVEPTVCVLFHDGKCIKNGTVAFVVGAELQRVEKPHQHGAVVRPVRSPHDRMKLLPISRPGGLELAHEIPERRFVCNRVNHLFDRLFRVVERGFGNLKEQAILARHALVVGDQLSLNPDFGS